MMCTFKEDVNLFVDGELPASRQVQLFKHLAACQECQSFIDMSLRVRELRGKEAVTFPPEIDEAVFARIAAQSMITHRARRIAREQVPFWHRNYAFPLPLAGVAAVIIILVGFVLGVFMPRASAPAVVQPPSVIVIYPMPPVDIVGKAVLQNVSKTDEIRN
jgi:anti-sigma factor RsiW